MAFGGRGGRGDAPKEAWRRFIFTLFERSEGCYPSPNVDDVLDGMIPAFDCGRFVERWGGNQFVRMFVERQSFKEWFEGAESQVENDGGEVEEWVKAGKLWRVRGGDVVDQIERRWEEENVVSIEVGKVRKDGKWQNGRFPEVLGEVIGAEREGIGKGGGGREETIQARRLVREDVGHAGEKNGERRSRKR